tara:strand:+ start:3415 stop:3738 length:324 start_codon:yes stop_codon:yes gene_type:complete
LDIKILIQQQLIKMTKETKHSTPEGTWYIAYSEDRINFSYGQAGKNFYTSLKCFEAFGTEKNMLERLNILHPTLLDYLKEEKEDGASLGTRPYFRSIDKDRINTPGQ